mgnify:CR=1 FL=1
MTWVPSSGPNGHGGRRCAESHTAGVFTGLSTACFSCHADDYANEVLAKLKAMGHNITTGGRQGDAHSVWVSPDGTIYGINEKRTPDGKASVPQLTTAAAGR